MDGQSTLAESDPGTALGARSTLAIETTRGSYVRRVLIAVGIAAVAIVLALAFRGAATAVMMAFSAVLVAVMLQAGADTIRVYTRLSYGWALFVFVLFLLIVFGAIVAFIAPQIASQVDELVKTVPQTLRKMQAMLDQWGWAQGLLADTMDPAQLAEKAHVAERAPGVISNVFSVVGGIAVTLFVGLYLAADPALYVRGVLHLVPLDQRDRLREVLLESGETLRHWLRAQLIAMTSAGVLTFLGLQLLGVPLALVLGILAGILEFVPNIGPILAFIPGVLFALAQGPEKALHVLLVYVGIQTFQSYVIQPMAQKEVAAIPPALGISFLVLMGLLLGTFGLFVATPFLCVLQVFIRRFYVEDILGDELQPLEARSG